MEASRIQVKTGYADCGLGFANTLPSPPGAQPPYELRRITH